MDCGVAQLVEQVAVNHRVGGSSPSTTAIIQNKNLPAYCNLFFYFSAIKSLLEVGRMVFSFSAESGSRAALTTLSWRVLC